MEVINVLVTGGNGQLARCIKDIEREYKGFNIIYKASNELDITNAQNVDAFFETHTIDWCINCAAYTNVDLAESEPEKVFNINVVGVENIVNACKKHKTTLVHISTDFVFDGKKPEPYSEEDQTNPISVYGESKLKGEIKISDNIRSYFIIRTSWLYSEHGNNFLKTMLRLAETKSELKIVNDQIGTPTYAKDLANVILDLISCKNDNFGLYHYSNEGVASWYDFAKAIFCISNTFINVCPIPNASYITSAKRPALSVMTKIKIKESFNIEIPYWRDSLKKCLNRMN